MTAYYNENNPKTAAWLKQLIKNGDIAPGEVDDRCITEVQPADLNGFDQCHFFAGIGGWSFALRLAGIPDDYPVWTGSCPCPPFSVAGKKKACPECQSASLLPHPYRTGVFACCDCGHQWFADARHLWPEFHRLIKVCRPAIVFGEQVAGADGEVWLAGVRATLEILGYGAGAANIGAHSVSAYHQRQRLYWMAHRDAIGCDSGSASAGCKTGQLSGISRSGEYSVMADGKGERCERGQNTAEQTRRSCFETSGAIMQLEITDNTGCQKQCWQPDQSARPATASGIEQHPTAWVYADENHLDWRTADWIYCRDDKWRPVKSASIRMASRIPRDMVCCCDYGSQIDAEKEGEINYANAGKNSTRKILRGMQCTNGEKANKRTLGGYDRIQKKEILQPEMHGDWSSKGGGNKFELQQNESGQKYEGLLRGVWKNNHITCPSCRRESFKQLAYQFDDVVRSMPHGSALAQFFCAEGTEYMQALRQTSNEDRSLLDTQYSLQEIWESLNDKEKSRVRVHFNSRAWVITETLKPLVDRLPKGVVRSGDSSAPIDANQTAEARVMRLRGYGNAIHPYLAAEFISASFESMECSHG